MTAPRSAADLRAVWEKFPPGPPAFWREDWYWLIEDLLSALEAREREADMAREALKVLEVRP